MGMMSLLLIQMFPTFLAVVAIYLIVLRDRRRLPGDRPRHAHGVILVYLGGRARRQHLADEGIPRLDPGLARRVRPRRRRDTGAGVLGDHPAARRARARRRRAALVHLHDQRVRHRERAAAVDGQVHAARSACTASSTTSTPSSGGRSARASCSRRSRWSSSSSSCSGSSPRASRAARSRGSVDERRCSGSAAPRRLGAVRARAAGRARRRVDGAPPRPARDRGRTPSPFGTSATASPSRRAHEVDRETDADVWWRATLPGVELDDPYRWLLSGGDFGYAWVNGVGMQPFDVPDADDFVASPDAGRPELAPRSRSSTRSSPIASRQRGSTSSRPTGRFRVAGTSCRPGAGRRRRSSGSAVTSSGSRSGSTTSRRSARTSST